MHLRSNVWGKNFASSTDTQTFENTTYTCAVPPACPSSAACIAVCH